VFNFIFNFFFLLVFLLLVQDFLGGGQRFISLPRGSRVTIAAILLVATTMFYLFPFASDHCLKAAAAEADIVKRNALIQRAAFFSPLDERVPLARAGILGSFARCTGNPEAWSDAMESLRRAQKLSRNEPEALIMEASLFREFLGEKARYPALAEEILAPLRRAEELAPFNPFLKLQQAVVLREHGRVQEARQRALAALALEPDYVAAILFVHELDGVPAGDPMLQERLSRIRDRAKALRVKPGSYLFKLYHLPEDAVPL
jgi:hypothetical protein